MNLKNLLNKLATTYIYTLLTITIHMLHSRSDSCCSCTNHGNSRKSETTGKIKVDAVCIPNRQKDNTIRAQLYNYHLNILRLKNPM